MERRSTGPLNRLRALGDAWARIFATSEDRRALHALVASRNPHDLPAMLRLVLSREPGVAEDAASAVEDYMITLGPRELLALDEATRRRYWWSTQRGERWGGVAPADAPRLRVHGAAVLGLASFHASGYVREASVRELAGIWDGAELPYLLIRMNDWVQPVQDAAYGAIRARLVPRYAPAIVRNLWLVDRLERCERADHAALLGTVQELLVSQEGRPALREALGSRHRWLRRRCYRLLLDTPADDASEVMRSALRDEDAGVRLIAIRRVELVLAPDRLAEVLAAAIRDRSMPVRSEALRLWVRHFPEGVDAMLRDALLDSHAAMRESARYHIRHRGFGDFREVYRSALDEHTGRLLRAAVYGLAETGKAHDAARIEPFMSHSAPGVRRAAVRALARLNPDAFVPAFVLRLEDGSPGVSRAARLALAGRTAGVAAEQLWEMVARGARAHVRMNALILLAGRGKWESIAWLIRACGLADERLARVAGEQVTRWIAGFNRDQNRPAGDQLERMARALDGAALDTERERMLRFLMKGY